MSIEISQNRRLQDASTPIHNAVHDIESFFWVLLYNCLTRTGRGLRRPDFESNDELRSTVCKLFEDNASLKQSCLLKNETLEKVLDFIHPDFNDFKDLFRKWRWSVLNGHRSDAVERHNIHAIVLNIMDKTIERIERSKSDSAEYAAEIRMRKDERRAMWKKWRKWCTHDNGRQASASDVEDHEIQFHHGYSPQAKGSRQQPEAGAQTTKLKKQKLTR